MTQCRYESGQTPFHAHLQIRTVNSLTSPPVSFLFISIYPPSTPQILICCPQKYHIEENETIKTFVQKMFTVICQSLHSQWSICSGNRINIYFDWWDVHMLPLKENVLIPCYFLPLHHHIYITSPTVNVGRFVRTLITLFSNAHKRCCSKVKKEKNVRVHAIE